MQRYSSSGQITECITTLLFLLSGFELLSFLKYMHPDARYATLLTLLQVLRHLPEQFNADVFGKLTDGSGSLLSGCERALRLPQDLLSRWVSTTPEALGLLNAQWTALQWSRLLSALAQDATHVTQIRLQLMDSPGMTSRNRCSSYRTSMPLGQLHEIEAEWVHVLRTLAGVLPQLTGLRCVGLHNLPVKTQLMPVLGQVLMSLPPSVTALSLIIAPSSRHDVDSLQRRMLFKAIGLVRSLRELHIANLEDIVGSDRACLEPLSRLPHLVRLKTKYKDSTFRWQ
jgi:hypothetical protein